MPNENEQDVKQPAVDTPEADTPSITLEEAMEKISKLEGINKDIIADRDKVKGKLREHEQTQTEKEKAFADEQKKYQDLLDKEKARVDSLQSKVRDRELDIILKGKLRETGLAEEAIDTAIALVDRAQIQYELDNGVDVDSLNSTIEALKTKHTILFQHKPKTPEVKRAAESSGTQTYIAELKKLRESGGTRRELDALRAKYNR